MNGSRATIADLRRFGLGTAQAFDAAVLQAMADMAPEDYD